MAWSSRPPSDAAPVSAVSSARRPQSRGSLTERCAKLQENMFLNLCTLNSHRAEMEKVVQERKEKAQKLREELMNTGTDFKLSSPPGSLLGIPPLSFQSMKDRVSALEDNVDSNQESMMQHRSILDSHHRRSIQDTVRQAKQDNPIRMGVQVQTLDMKAPLVDRCQIIEENARRISSRLQESAKESARSQSVAESGNKVQRPASAPSTRSTGLTSAVRRPGSAVAGRGVSVAGAPPSRPCTPNTLTARIRALESNSMRNKKTLASHRTTLDEIVQFRRQQTEAAFCTSP